MKPTLFYINIKLPNSILGFRIEKYIMKNKYFLRISLGLCLIISSVAFSQNAYSSPRNRTGWIEPTNQNLTARLLMEKQNAYNRNLQAILPLENKVIDLANSLRNASHSTDSSRSTKFRELANSLVELINLRKTADISDPSIAQGYIDSYYEILEMFEKHRSR